MNGPRDDTELAGLIAKARTGDGEALGALLEAFRDDLRALADRLLDGRMAGRLDASDMVQMTCLSVHRKIEEFVGNDAAQFAAWLRQVHERNVRNAVRDHLHVAKRAATSEEALDGRDVGERQPVTPSRLIIRRESTEQLVAALDRLPQDEGAILRKRYLEDKTLPELCAELNLTRDAAVWLIQKAMRRLRTELRDDGVS